MNNLKVELANEKHFSEIKEIITESFQGPESPYLAIGQTGYGEFLYEALKQNPRGSKFIIAAITNGRVAAFADITHRLDGPNFLTRVAVKPEYRGHALAVRLMRSIQKNFVGQKSWELDVFQSNPNAMRLYKSLGFETVNTKHWLGRYITAQSDRPFPQIQSSKDMAYERFGFTSGKIEERSVSIAGTAVRCHDLASFLSDPFLVRVKQHYPEIDRAFIVSNGIEYLMDSYTNIYSIGKSYRMLGSF